jgi:AcrR family transcriptional regulator
VRSSTEPSKLGRPRDPHLAEAVLEATLQLVGEIGLTAMTVDAVAQRAGVGKAAIYRRWTSKEAMLLEAWRDLVEPVDLPDTGSLRGDLTVAMAALAGPSSGDVVRRSLPHLIAAARVNPDLEATLNDFFEERRRPLRAVLARAADRGELRPDIDLELLHDLVVGPLIYRRMITGRSLGPRQQSQLVEMVIAAATGD